MDNDQQKHSDSWSIEIGFKDNNEVTLMQERVSENDCFKSVIKVSPQKIQTKNMSDELSYDLNSLENKINIRV